MFCTPTEKIKWLEKIIPYVNFTRRVKRSDSWFKLEHRRTSCGYLWPFRVFGSRWMTLKYSWIIFQWKDLAVSARSFFSCHCIAGCMSLYWKKDELGSSTLDSRSNSVVLYQYIVLGPDVEENHKRSCAIVILFNIGWLAQCRLMHFANCLVFTY